MIKLYKRTDGRVTEYYEAWLRDATIIEHWGQLGTEGSTREHSVDPNLSETENLERVLAPARALGFERIDLDDHAVLLVEFVVADRFADSDELGKRYELDERLDQTLGWTGLGHVDGGSSGSGTMEVCCYVVDFEIAKRVVREDLAETEFADYSRIYEE